MEDRNVMPNQGGEGLPRTLKPANQPPGNDAEREREHGESDKPDARPTPSGVPNEGRSVARQGREEQQAQRDDFEYRGGRQGQDGVPNPDHANDDKSGGSLRTAAEIETDAQLDLASSTVPDDDTEGEGEGADIDDDDEEDESDEASQVTGQSRNDELDSQPRNPE